MNWSPIPPAVAAVAAAAISLTRRVPTVVLESSVGVPSPRALTLYTLGGRAVAFVLVYGLLLGAAYRVGRRGDGVGRRGDGVDVGATALAAGVVAAVVSLVGTAAILLWVEPQQGAVTAVSAVGSAVGVGVQLGVVAFAGLALGRSRIHR
ncbi:hypothetical protein C461_12403 [Halorubrum aidingense JCM 13560]|uniref:Uncharacterized protein n=1 Tax=Halorubrum aidingense JCM 13560 TaxID=1230454 RepID=M0P8V4_9EURY|nr:hypothetical protein [Halorubrum aidingense]EMA65974.1 hypothetical protein C461_12403 [Halorubrum aidingense JCM 13560]